MPRQRCGGGSAALARLAGRPWLRARGDSPLGAHSLWGWRHGQLLVARGELVGGARFHFEAARLSCVEGRGWGS